MLANFALPMLLIPLFFRWGPFVFVLIFPITCLVEAYLIKRILNKRKNANFVFSLGKVLKPIIVANVISSLIGRLFISGSSLLWDEIYWLRVGYLLYIPFLMLLMYIITVLIEWTSIKIIFHNMRVKPSELLRSLWIANAISYSILVMTIVILPMLLPIPS